MPLSVTETRVSCPRASWTLQVRDLCIWVAYTAGLENTPSLTFTICKQTDHPRASPRPWYVAFRITHWGHQQLIQDLINISLAAGSIHRWLLCVFVCVWPQLWGIQGWLPSLIHHRNTDRWRTITVSSYRAATPATSLSTPAFDGTHLAPPSPSPHHHQHSKPSSTIVFEAFTNWVEQCHSSGIRKVTMKYGDTLTKEAFSFCD